MAKIKTRAARDQRLLAYTAGNLGLRAGHKVKAAIWVWRTSGRGRESFRACVKVGGEGAARSVSARGSCGYGSNPRRAIASAFRTSAKYDVGARTGAFAGFSGRKR